MPEVTARFVPDEAPGGLYGSRAYLSACATHEGARFGTLVAGPVELPALQSDGAVTTPYGYPQPIAPAEEWDVAAAALAKASFPWRIALSPLAPGSALAEALAGQLQPTTARAICVHDLDRAEDPERRFSKKARAEVRGALRRGARIESGPPSAEFGARYRVEMKELAADPIYFFDDDYFEAMTEAGGWQLVVHDDAGPAAGALFIVNGSEASYHLSWRRRRPVAVAGAANLLVAAGLHHCRELGAAICYLGGGFTHSEDDALFVFKRAMATRILPRPTFVSP